MRGHFPKHSESPSAAYTRFRKLRNTFWFFKELVKDGPAVFERSQSKHIAKTNHLEIETVKRIKARFRNELSIGGPDGK